MTTATQTTTRERQEWEILVRKKAHLAGMVYRPYWWQERYDALMARKAHLESILWPEATSTEARPCFWCNGSGRTPNDDEQRYDVCSACAGSGIVPVRQFAEPIAA
jgi:hypothetical protein